MSMLKLNRLKFDRCSRYKNSVSLGCFFVLFLAGLFLLKGLNSFFLGLGLMSFLIFSIVVFVRGLTQNQKSLWGLILMIFKWPVSLGIILFAQSMPGFNLISFVVGVLILLPSLVILSI